MKIEINDNDWEQNKLFKEIVDLFSVIQHYTRVKDYNKVTKLNIVLTQKKNKYDRLYPDSKDIFSI